MIYKIIIVEDERHQQEMLGEMLRDNFKDFEVAGFASSVPEAKELLIKHAPDLVFLDVQLPPYTSFDLLSSLDEISFDIIFTTSYEEYAVKAFRLSAVDYLLKPVAIADLEQAMEKFRHKKIQSDTSAHIKTLLENFKVAKADHAKIALPTFKGYIFVPVKSIVRCESDNTYTTFYTSDKKKIIVSKTLKECELLLVGYRFFRVHNSHLINLDYISEYTKGEGGTVTMSDGSGVDVSRRRKDEFLRILKKG